MDTDTKVVVDDIDTKILLVTLDLLSIHNGLPLRFPDKIPLEEKEALFKRLRSDEILFLRDFYNRHIGDKKESLVKSAVKAKVAVKKTGSKRGDKAQYGKESWTYDEIRDLAKLAGEGKKLPWGSTKGMAEKQMTVFKSLRAKFRYEHQKGGEGRQSGKSGKKTRRNHTASDDESDGAGKKVSRDVAGIIKRVKTYDDLQRETDLIRAAEQEERDALEEKIRNARELAGLPRRE